MTNQPNHEESLSDPAFQSLLVSCLERLERGEQLDPEALLQANPQHAHTLTAFLNDQAMLRHVASELRDSISPRKPEGAAEQLAQTVDSYQKKGPITRRGQKIRYIGEYEILDEIARGGMGVVYKARQQKLDRTVALKMLLAGELAGATEIERFQREARAAGRLKHPQIVPIHEIGEHEGHHYFAMDYVEGHGLNDILRDQTLTPHRAAKLVCEVAEAVEYAHQQGVVHRDLKPANILVDAAGAPHVTDFGLARVHQPMDGESRPELTTTGQILGTPTYMSPEQASGTTHAVGPASDVYGLGGILFASLTGRAPFIAESPVETLRQVIHDEPISPRQLNAKTPRDLEQICLKCLRKNAKDRYASAAELAADLRRFAAGEPVEARPLPVVTRLYRWSDRNIGKFTSLAIGFVLLIPLVVFLAFGLLIERWPWPLLLISYPLMLVLSAPYLLMILITGARARALRTRGRPAVPVKQTPSIPLLALGGVLLAGAIGAYGWLLLKHGWAVPQESRFLVFVAILGVGAIIRGLK